MSVASFVIIFSAIFVPSLFFSVQEEHEVTTVFYLLRNTVMICDFRSHCMTNLCRKQEIANHFSQISSAASSTLTVRPQLTEYLINQCHKQYAPSILWSIREPQEINSWFCDCLTSLPAVCLQSPYLFQSLGPATIPIFLDAIWEDADCCGGDQYLWPGMRDCPHSHPQGLLLKTRGKSR